MAAIFYLCFWIQLAQPQICYLQLATSRINKTNFMQELIERLKVNAQLTDEQAVQVLVTVKEYVKEKFPMLGGAVDNLLGGE